MQDKKLNYVLLSVPLEALEDAGIRPGISVMRSNIF